MAKYNFGVVVNNEHYQVYRSAALGSKGLAYVSRELKSLDLPFPKTIIYLNSQGYGVGGFATQEIALQKKYGYKFIHIYLDGNRPNKEKFFKVVKLILDQSNQPVLFHCYGGLHRTGMTALALRYIQEGNWVDGPKRHKFVLAKMHKLWLNPAQYEYVVYNPILFRSTNLRYIEEVSKMDEFIELKDQYGIDLRD